jgi:hypothetical protein
VHIGPQTEIGVGSQNAAGVSPDGNTGGNDLVNACKPDGAFWMQRFRERAAVRCGWREYDEIGWPPATLLGGPHGCRNDCQDWPIARGLR